MSLSGYRFVPNGVDMEAYNIEIAAKPRDESR
jgi:hypothetical protein